MSIIKRMNSWIFIAVLALVSGILVGLADFFTAGGGVLMQAMSSGFWAFVITSGIGCWYLEPWKL